MKIGLPSAGEQLSYSSSQVVITFFINMLGVEASANTHLLCSSYFRPQPAGGFPEKSVEIVPPESSAVYSVFS